MTVQHLALCITALMLIVVVASLIAPTKMVAGIQTLPSVPRFWLAVLIRLAVAGLFVLAAPQCRVPWLINVFAVLVAIAALTILFAGRARLDRMLEWIAQQSSAVVRAWLAVGLTVAISIVYGVGV